MIFSALSAIEGCTMVYSGYLFAQSLLCFLRCRKQMNEDAYIAVLSLVNGIANLGASFCILAIVALLHYAFVGF